MKPRLQATRAVRELIKAYEPFHAHAVRRGRRWVIGWGHRATAKDGAAIKPDDAELLLIYDALRAQDAVDAMVGGDVPNAARDALASFAASIGLSAFKVSDVARLAKSGRMREAGAALDSWVRAEEDGRLVVSDRLVERRRAEKTLLLEALDGPARDDAPEAAVEVEPAAGAAVEDEPRLGPLVDVDIAFEDEPATISAPNPEADADPDDVSQDADAPEAAVAPSLDADAVDDVDDAALQTEAPDAAAAEEPETADSEREAAAGGEEDRKIRQDAAIAAVMGRMASDMAESVGAAPSAEETKTDDEAAPEPGAAAAGPAPETPAAPVKLGYSFLQPGTIAADPEPGPDAQEPGAPEDEPDAEPGSAAAEPEPDAEPAPTPVYATVSVSTPPSPDSVAPPHPALAPASAPGLSGESEGPDHPDEDEADAAHEEDALEPAMVAGAEAADPAPAAARKSGGGWVYPALLAIGAALTGLGAWELTSHWEAYSSMGLEFSPLGPVVFGAGVLLAVGAGWFVFRKR